MKVVAEKKNALLRHDFDMVFYCLRLIARDGDQQQRSGLLKTMSSALNEIEELSINEGRPVTSFIRAGFPVNVTGEVYKMLKSGRVKGMKPKQGKKELQPSKVVRRRRALLKPLGDGRHQCKVCFRVLSQTSKCCKICSLFALRVHSLCNYGMEFPTCTHVKYNGLPRCRSCRYRRFSGIGMAEMNPKTAERSLTSETPLVCPICNRERILWVSKGMCSDCYFFVVDLKTREECGDPLQPECQHYEEQIGCLGCRFARLKTLPKVDIDSEEGLPSNSVDKLAKFESSIDQSDVSQMMSMKQDNETFEGPIAQDIDDLIEEITETREDAIDLIGLELKPADDTPIGENVEESTVEELPTTTEQDDIPETTEATVTSDDVYTLEGSFELVEETVDTSENIVALDSLV